MKSQSVTSPLSTSDGPGELGGHRLEVGLRPGDQRHPGPALREGVGQQPTEASARAGDDHPLAGHVGGTGEGRGDVELSGHRPSLVTSPPLCTDQYNTRFMFTDAELVEMHRRMLVIRGFEERVAGLYRDGEVPGFVHLSIGQEASAVGACWPLARTDVITSTHRGHGHCLAKGLDPLGMFAELMARDAGTNRGRGGSMHIADPAIGIFGANGIVGAGLPIAAGAATAAQLRSDGSVAVAFFGDGAVAHGTFHEAINLAAVWKLPVIFFCENNGYAEFSPAATQHAASLEQRAAGYGADHVAVDGNDVVATAAAMRDVVEATRREAGRLWSRRPRIAGTVTTRAIRSVTARPTRCASGRRAIRWSCTRAAYARRVSPTASSSRWRRRLPASSTMRSNRHVRWPRPRSRPCITSSTRRAT